MSPGLLSSLPAGWCSAGGTPRGGPGAHVGAGEEAPDRLRWVLGLQRGGRRSTGSSRAQSGTSACLLVSLGLQGASSSTKLTCLKQHSPRITRGTRLCAASHQQLLVTPYPWGAAGLAWECCWRPLSYNRGLGLQETFFFHLPNYEIIA